MLTSFRIRVDNSPSIERRRFILGVLFLAGFGAAVLSLLAPRVVFAGESARQSHLVNLASRAFDSNPETAASAVQEIRALGPQGFEYLLQKYAPEVAQLMRVPSRERSNFLNRLSSILASVAGQKDSYASRLFWHTDFAQAKKEAQLLHHPILSLRLLGRLDEDLSCANSRFFRTLIYPNSKVSQYLRQNYVLHWESVRPVPVATIDFGDGRILKKPLTGNSVHYVFDEEGRIVDAIPGLYGPAAFLMALDRAAEAAKPVVSLDDQVRAEKLSSFHLKEINRLGNNWRRLVAAAGIPAGQNSAPVGTDALSWKKIPGQKESNSGFPSAKEAALLTYRKSIVELPAINALENIGTSEKNSRRTAPPIDEETLLKLAASNLSLAEIDQTALRLVLLKAPTENRPNLRYKIVRELAADSVQNEYVFHFIVHSWLSQRPLVSEKELTKKIYSELFKTPSEDPWLGLHDPMTFSALDEGQVILQK